MATETERAPFRLPRPGDPGRNAGATKELASYMQELQGKGELEGYSFLLADNREAHPDDFAASLLRLLKADVEGTGIDITDQIAGGGF